MTICHCSHPLKASNARENNWKRHGQLTDAWLNAQLLIENCTNFAQTILFAVESRRATIGNCFLCTFQSVVHEGGEDQALNIRTHKKGTMADLVVLCPIQPT